MRRFTEAEADKAAEWGRAQFRRARPDLTFEELGALRRYKEGYYSVINEMCRGTGHHMLPPGYDCWRDIFRLDDALAKGRMGEEVVVYRGHFAPPGLIEAFDSQRLTNLQDDAFWSVSLLPQEAEIYCDAHEGRGLFLEIHLKQGQTGIYMDVEEMGDLHQYELLLPRKPIMAVTNLSRGPAGRRVVAGTIVPFHEAANE